MPSTYSFIGLEGLSLVGGAGNAKSLGIEGSGARTGSGRCPLEVGMELALGGTS